MDLFIARQPIFNLNLRLHAYELLYRGTQMHRLEDRDGDRATASVLTSTFLTEGIDRISDSKPCFINFTRALLLQKLPAAFPKTQIVVEVLEDVPPTPDIVKVCRELKDEGYTIALDDFIFDRSLIPLIELADIIKIDCILTPLDSIYPTLNRLKSYNLKYLAEKVETYDQFERAKKLGFNYFQGYFFTKPEKIKIKEVAAAKISLVNLLAEVNRTDTSLTRLEQIVSSDAGLSYKLLRFINSSYFYRINKIESVRHAVVYLGDKELRRFISLVIISEIASDKPTELVRLALIRAKFLELLGQKAEIQESREELFLLGLFSLLDAMLDTDMNSIGGRLPLSDKLRDALVMQSGPLAPFLFIPLCYENRDKPGCLSALHTVGIKPAAVAPAYLEAITFARAILG